MLQHQPLLKQLKPLHLLPISACSGPQILSFPYSKTLGAELESLLVLSARGSRWDLSPQLWHKEQFCILSCLDWAKGFCMNYFLFNLFKGFSIERACKQTVVWNVHSPKTCRKNT